MRWGYQIIIVLCICCISTAYTQTFEIDDILEDIYNQLSEEGDIPLEDVQEELLEIATSPINLNQTTADELSRLHLSFRSLGERNSQQRFFLNHDADKEYYCIDDDECVGNAELSF